MPPGYRSNANLPLGENTDAKSARSVDDRPEELYHVADASMATTSTKVSPKTTLDTHGKQNVHYPDQEGGALHNSPDGFQSRQGSGDLLGSRAPSLMSDDDDEEETYDWSDEEDLLDEEAKYEKKMGNRSAAAGPKKWGPKRYVHLRHSNVFPS